MSYVAYETVFLSRRLVLRRDYLLCTLSLCVVLVNSWVNSPFYFWFVSLKLGLCSCFGSERLSSRRLLSIFDILVSSSLWLVTSSPSVVLLVCIVCWCYSCFFLLFGLFSRLQIHVKFCRIWLGSSTVSGSGLYLYHRIIHFVLLPARTYLTIRYTRNSPLMLVPFFVGSVFICAVIFVWYVIILVASVFISVVFYTWNTAISVGSITRYSVASGQRHFVHGHCIFYPVLVHLTSSCATDMTLNGPTAFGDNFIKGMLAMHADTVICAVRLSTKTGCPGWIAAFVRQFCWCCTGSWPLQS